MTEQDPQHPLTYDFDLAVRTIRDKMDDQDVFTVATKCIAEGFTKVMRGNLGAHELVPACRGLIMSGGTLGHLSTKLAEMGGGVNSNSINLILNVQSVAAVMILDELEIERLEAELEAGS